jgi:serine/threonine protein kinase
VIDPERWKAVESIYHAALAVEPARRSSFVNQACSQDPILLREVESLIAYADQGERMLANSPLRPMDESKTFGIGAVLSQRFRVTKLLGCGGMGEVYEAEDLILGERVALKTLRTDVADQDHMRKRLLQEVQAAKRVAHPGLCRIHDLHVHQQVTYLTMELLEGETLGARIRTNNGMDLSEASPIAEQLAGALSAAHRAGIIHRDFKPDNVILTTGTEQGLRVVITDFGLARPEARPAGAKLTRTGQIVGTLAYMAPEQLLAQTITRAVDIYAFGVVLYEMVTGKQPHAGKSQLAMAANRLKALPPAPRTIRADLPLEWNDTILRCLEPDPAKRFADAWDVWRVLSFTKRHENVSNLPNSVRR